MNYIFEVDGKSKSEAEKLALDILQLEAEDVIFKADNTKRGFLGFVSKKPSQLRVYIANDNIPTDSVIAGVILTLIKKMGISADIEDIKEIDSNILVELASEDSRMLIGKQGRTLDALQFILNLMIDSKYRRGKRIMLDVANYRSRRKKRLQKLAMAVADRVSRTKKPVLLEYMNPYDRRIVHLTIESDDRVFTKSDGNGVYKRVRVIPQEQAEQYRDDEEDRNYNYNNDDEY